MLATRRAGVPPGPYATLQHLATLHDGDALVVIDGCHHVRAPTWNEPSATSSLAQERVATDLFEAYLAERPPGR